jgi:glycosyltransferase involved in cell wall biosynthesis
MFPLVSIGMPVWNSEATLSLTIHSLILQTYTNWELLLLDDGSSDATVAVARAFQDTRIRIYSDSQRLGLAARLNQAIDYSHGVFFARLDADDIAYPNRLEIQVAFLLANQNIDLVGSAGMVFSNQGDPIGILPVQEAHEKICRTPWSGFYLGHPTWMGKMDWFRKHRYDATAIKAQDLDLMLRTYKTSRFFGLPQILIGYRQDRISIRKCVVSRYHVALALIRSRSQLGIFNLNRGLLGQFFKGIVDVVALSTGLNRRILKHRANPLISTNEIQNWKQVFDACNERRF